MPAWRSHAFPGTGLTANSGNPVARLAQAQQITTCSEQKTTQAFDPRSDEISLNRVKKIGFRLFCSIVTQSENYIFETYGTKY